MGRVMNNFKKLLESQLKNKKWKIEEIQSGPEKGKKYLLFGKYGSGFEIYRTKEKWWEVMYNFEEELDQGYFGDKTANSVNSVNKYIDSFNKNIASHWLNYNIPHATEKDLKSLDIVDIRKLY